MAKITVYEDDIDDLIDRYGALNKAHEVHVRADGNLCADLSEQWARSDLLAAGFVGDRIGVWVRSQRQPEESDVYFLDGLKGGCFTLLGQLPKDKTFLNTTNGELLERARKREYGDQVLTSSVEEAIERTISQ